MGYFQNISPPTHICALPIGQNQKNTMVQTIYLFYLVLFFKLIQIKQGQQNPKSSMYSFRVLPNDILISSVKGCDSLPHCIICLLIIYLGVAYLLQTHPCHSK